MCLRSGLNPQSYGHEAVTLPLHHSDKGASPKNDLILWFLVGSLCMKISSILTFEEVDENREINCVATMKGARWRQTANANVSVKDGL